MSHLQISTIRYRTGGGSNDSVASHRSSSKTGLARIAPPCSAGRYLRWAGPQETTRRPAQLAAGTTPQPPECPLVRYLRWCVYAYSPCVPGCDNCSRTRRPQRPAGRDSIAWLNSDVCSERAISRSVVTRIVGSTASFSPRGTRQKAGIAGPGEGKSSRNPRVAMKWS